MIAIGNHPPPPIQNQAAPTFLTKDELIKKIALPILLEIGISIAICVVVGCFAATTAGIGLMVSVLVIQCAVSAFFRCVGAFAAHDAAKKGPGHKILAAIAEAMEWTAPLSFVAGSGHNAQILIHEGGHALAASLVYTNARPTVKIIPPLGGWTEYYPHSGLTALGNKLGAKGSEFLVVASGPRTTLCLSAAAYASGLLLRQKHSTLSKYLMTWGAFDFINHIFYAFTAFFTSPANRSHDFVHLSLLGLHPTIAIARMIAIPVLLNLGINGLQKKPHPFKLVPRLT